MKRGIWLAIAMFILNIHFAVAARDSFADVLFGTPIEEDYLLRFMYFALIFVILYKVTKQQVFKEDKERRIAMIFSLVISLISMWFTPDNVLSNFKWMLILFAPFFIIHYMYGVVVKVPESKEGTFDWTRILISLAITGLLFLTLSASPGFSTGITGTPYVGFAMDEAMQEVNYALFYRLGPLTTLILIGAVIFGLFFLGRYVFKKTGGAGGEGGGSFSFPRYVVLLFLIIGVMLLLMWLARGIGPGLSIPVPGGNLLFWVLAGLAIALLLFLLFRYRSQVGSGISRLWGTRAGPWIIGLILLGILIAIFFLAGGPAMLGIPSLSGLFAGLGGTTGYYILGRIGIALLLYLFFRLRGWRIFGAIRNWFGGLGGGPNKQKMLYVKLIPGSIINRKGRRRFVPLGAGAALNSALRANLPTTSPVGRLLNRVTTNFPRFSFEPGSAYAFQVIVRRKSVFTKPLLNDAGVTIRLGTDMGEVASSEGGDFGTETTGTTVRGMMSFVYQAPNTPTALDLTVMVSAEDSLDFANTYRFSVGRGGARALPDVRISRTPASPRVGQRCTIRVRAVDPPYTRRFLPRDGNGINVELTGLPDDRMNPNPPVDVTRANTAQFIFTPTDADANIPYTFTANVTHESFVGTASSIQRITAQPRNVGDMNILVAYMPTITLPATSSTFAVAVVDTATGAGVDGVRVNFQQAGQPDVSNVTAAGGLLGEMRFTVPAGTASGTQINIQISAAIADGSYRDVSAGTIQIEVAPTGTAPAGVAFRVIA